jgi:serine/threonine protein kinase
LIEDGLVITEPEVARFASDVRLGTLFPGVVTCVNHFDQILSGLAYLEGLSIAHRDVRSDNLLLSRIGVLKLGLWHSFDALLFCGAESGLLHLADFSHAVVTQRNELCTSVIPVPPYWMVC